MASIGSARRRLEAHRRPVICRPQPNLR
jgi:hypothetical protein